MWSNNLKNPWKQSLGYRQTAFLKVRTMNMFNDYMIFHIVPTFWKQIGNHKNDNHQYFGTWNVAFHVKVKFTLIFQGTKFYGIKKKILLWAPTKQAR